MNPVSGCFLHLSDWSMPTTVLSLPIATLQENHSYGVISTP